MDLNIACWRFWTRKSLLSLLFNEKVKASKKSQFFGKKSSQKMSPKPSKFGQSCNTGAALDCCGYPIQFQNKFQKLKGGNLFSKIYKFLIPKQSSLLEMDLLGSILGSMTGPPKVSAEVIKHSSIFCFPLCPPLKPALFIQNCASFIHLAFYSVSGFLGINLKYRRKTFYIPQYVHFVMLTIRNMKCPLLDAVFWPGKRALSNALLVTNYFGLQLDVVTRVVG